MCVAAVISLCDSLEEIRLSNCGIKDQGAQNLFSELSESRSVLILELSNNPISNSCFSELVSLLNSNNKI